MVLQSSRVEGLGRSRVVQTPRLGGYTGVSRLLGPPCTLLQGAEQFVWDGQVEIQAPSRGAALAAAPRKTEGTAMEMAAEGMITDTLPLD